MHCIRINNTVLPCKRAHFLQVLQKLCLFERVVFGVAVANEAHFFNGIASGIEDAFAPNVRSNIAAFFIKRFDFYATVVSRGNGKSVGIFRVYGTYNKINITAEHGPATSGLAVKPNVNAEDSASPGHKWYEWTEAQAVRCLILTGCVSFIGAWWAWGKGYSCGYAARSRELL